MRGLFFDISGKFAHFRRFYTNSSSLTYFLPPPTVVAGIVAASMGLNSEEYPDLFENISYTIRPLNNHRTIMATVNLLYVSTVGELTGYKGAAQIPTQILVPEDFSTRISYEIGIVSDDNDLLEKMYKSIISPVFPPYLGVAYCLAKFSNPRIVSGSVMNDVEDDITGAIRASLVDKIEDVKEGQKIVKDRYPLRLDKERKLLVADDILFDNERKTIKGKFKKVFATGGIVYGLV